MTRRTKTQYEPTGDPIPVSEWTAASDIVKDTGAWAQAETESKTWVRMGLRVSPAVRRDEPGGR